jgi:hypothetical protein
MKWYYGLSLLTLVALPATASAQTIETVAIGHITQVNDRAPTNWGMSGMDIFRITQSTGNMTPIMRSMACDARTVEILSRTQSPPLRASDVKTVNHNGRQYIVVRRYLLTEVTPADARAEKTTVANLARQWAAGVRNVFPKVAPTPNRFGA